MPLVNESNFMFQLPSIEELKKEYFYAWDQALEAMAQGDYAYARQWQEKRRSAELAIARKLVEEQA